MSKELDENVTLVLRIVDRLLSTQLQTVETQQRIGIMFEILMLKRYPPITMSGKFEDITGE